MTLAERCRIAEGLLFAAADELERQEEEITKLRRAIYRAVDHRETVLIDRDLLQGIIAEFEPNHVT